MGVSWLVALVEAFFECNSAAFARLTVISSPAQVVHYTVGQKYDYHNGMTASSARALSSSLLVSMRAFSAILPCGLHPSLSLYTIIVALVQSRSDSCIRYSEDMLVRKRPRPALSPTDEPN